MNIFMQTCIKTNKTAIVVYEVICETVLCRVHYPSTNLLCFRFSSNDSSQDKWETYAYFLPLCCMLCAPEISVCSGCLHLAAIVCNYNFHVSYKKHKTPLSALDDGQCCHCAEGNAAKMLLLQLTWDSSAGGGACGDSYSKMLRDMDKFYREQGIWTHLWNGCSLCGR